MLKWQEKDLTHSDDMRQLNIVQYAVFLPKECCMMLQLHFFNATCIKTNKKNLDLQLRSLTC